VAQCVVVLADGRLRIAKAEGRPPGVEGSVFRYALEGGRPVLEAAPAAAKLGAALRALRVSRRMSQSELAGLAGVSSSAVSQAERGRRGLSLETLLDLTGRLGITLDDLLRGEVAPGYRLVRRDDPRQATRDEPVPLLDDPRAGLRAYAVRLSPGGSAEPAFAHKGVELVAVAAGLVQVLLETGRPVLRTGEALIADTSGVAGWRNLGEREALVFWVLHDEPLG
jgi:transcriptional regulator with XRE-family HTH domain